MSVDTFAERLSLIGFGSPVPRALPPADGSFDAYDRAQLAFLYRAGLAPPWPGPEPEPEDDMAQQGIKTGFAAILLSIRARLIEILGDEDILGDLRIPASRILFARINQVPRWQPPSDVVLRVTAPRPLSGFWEGHGEVAPGFVRGLIVEIRSRLATDISDRVNLWLLQVQTTLEDAVLRALISERPMEVVEPTNVLTIYGLELVAGREYQDTLDKVPPPDDTWGSSVFTFAVPYNPVCRDLPEVEE